MSIICESGIQRNVTMTKDNWTIFFCCKRVFWEKDMSKSFWNAKSGLHCTHYLLKVHIIWKQISMRETHFVRTGIPIIWRKKQVIVKTIKIIIWEILIYSGSILFGKAAVKQHNQSIIWIRKILSPHVILQYWSLASSLRMMYVHYDIHQICNG